MNTKRKTGFNIIDAFVILIILALIAGTVYFAWRKTKEPSSQLKEKNITYTVRVSGVSADFVPVFKQNGLVYNSSTLGYVGTIKKIRMENAAVLTDKAAATGTEENPGYTVIQQKYGDVYDVYLTVNAKTLLDQRGVAYVDDERITIGSRINIRTENFSCEAYITAFTIG
jgi:hypothetical protein